MQFRTINNNEKKILKENFCEAEDWKKIKVAEGFNPERVQNTTFFGEVKLGANNEEVDLGPKRSRKSGIINSTISNSIIGDNVFIKDVEEISQYKIGNKAIIENTGMILKEGETSFGNGIKIEVLNEGGGRELPLFSELNAQLAYMLVHYRHRKDFIERMENIIERKVDKIDSTRGVIQQNSHIRNTERIKNVNIGAFTRLYSTSVLEEGTIRSTKSSPVIINNISSAKKFIIRKGSKLENDVIIEKCFIGESVEISAQFSAENSAVFANSEFMHGEACSLLAGPFSVSHHKSSLLIANMTSFFNAGSGTNQSNHMYKLGPLHQGILERGCKTGSFSYLLWPSRVGAFSVVRGKHNTQFNTEKFPFSYIEKSDQDSILNPAMNLATVGTLRDSRKWPRRDGRINPEEEISATKINFDLFSPYTISKVLEALNVSTELYEKATKKQNFVRYNGIKIKRLLLRTAKKYYKIPIHIFIGDQFVEKYEQVSPTDFEELKEKAFLEPDKIEREWVDLLGMITPKKELNQIIEQVENKEINEINNFQSQLYNLYKKFNDLTWRWTIGLIEKFYDKKLEKFTNDDFIEIIDNWRDNKNKFNNIIIKDAKKEFSKDSRIGYGIDGNENIKDTDFRAVRGKIEENDFIKSLEEEKEQVNNTAKDILQKLKT